MSTTIDFHSHILPRVDDGSQSVEESMTMLRMEAEQGVRHVVATPHFYPRHDTPELFLSRRARAEEKLREQMEKEPGLPQLSIGAEVYYYSGISDSEVISELTIGENRCILIEMPQSPWSESMYQELEGLYIKRGLIPVIAHIDRYIGRFRTFGIPQRLAQLPVMVQANAEFFLHRSTASMALRMLKEDRIQLLGSDCHDLSSRSPNLGDAVKYIEDKLGKDIFKRIHGYEKMIFAPDSVN